MGKFIGLLTCTLVVGIAVWLARPDGPAKTISAGIEPGERASHPLLDAGSPSARELLTEGTRLHNAGRHADAVRTLEAARAAQGGLSALETQDLYKFLRLARAEVAKGHPVSASVESVKERVDGLMRRAEMAAQLGQRGVAIRFARSAEALARRHGLFYHPNEVTPAEMLARLEGRPVPPRRIVPPASARPAPAGPEDATVADRRADSPFTMVSKDRGIEQIGYQQTTPGAGPDLSSEPAPGAPDVFEPPVRPEPPTSAAPAALPGVATEKKQQAVALMRQARQAFDAGDLAAARAHALEAHRLGVVWTLYDETPQQLLQMIEEQTVTTTIAGEDAPPSPTVNAEPGPTAAAEFPTASAIDVESPASPSQTSTQQTTPKKLPPFDEWSTPVTRNPVAVANRQKAQALLEEAEQAAAAGRFAEAREKVRQVESLNVVYNLFDKRPAIVLSDIDRMEAVALVKAPSEPAPTRDPAAAADHLEAKRILQQARSDAQAGRFESAREKVRQVREMDVAFEPLEDRPELVAEYVTKLEAFQQQIASERESAPDVPNPFAATDAQPATEPTEPPAARTPEALAKREQALGLLNQAYSAAQAGRFAEARQRINEAIALDAVYDRFDDRPITALQYVEGLEQFQAEIAQKREQEARPPAGANAGATDSEPSTVTAMTDVESDADAGAEPQRETAGTPNPLPIRETPNAAGGTANPFVVDTNVGMPQPAPNGAAPNGAAPNGAAPNGAARRDAIEPVAASRPAPADRFVDAAVIHPSGVSAVGLFDRGLRELDAGREAQAYQTFLECFRTGLRMDPWRTQALQDYLQSLRQRVGNQDGVQLTSAEGGDGAGGDGEGGKPRTGGRKIGPDVAAPLGPGNALDEAEREMVIRYEKLRSEAMNAIFKADRLREKDSTRALEEIDRAIAACGTAELSAEQVAPLLRQLRRSRTEIETYQRQRAPNIALEERNQRIKAEIEKDIQTKIRVEQELASLVDEYNELFKQRRYAEAEVLAKQAKDLDPENPVAETMIWKAKFARRDARNEEIKLAKEEGFWGALDEVEEAAIPFSGDPMQFPKNWRELTERRRASEYGADNRTKTEKEKRIERSLSRPINLHFDDTPFQQVFTHLAATTGVDIVLDDLGLEEEGVTSNTLVTIHVDGVMLKSALNLILGNRHLAYVVEDEVLKITSELRAQGKLEVRTYPVADLVVPIPNMGPASPFGVSNGQMPMGGGAFNMPSMGGVLQPVGGANFQVPDQPGRQSFSPFGNPMAEAHARAGNSAFDFDTLSDLIVSTVRPDTWVEAGGDGSVRSFETTLSLVIRQTQRVHEEIRDLLEQLRRLQDLQVTIEVRFITVADRFAEQIGVDFDFQVQDNVEADTLNMPQFGLPGQQQGQQQQGQQQQGQQQQGQQQQGQQQQGAAGPGGLQPPANLLLPALDDWPQNGTIAGLASPGQFTPDLDLQFQQGSFDVGVPDFAPPGLSSAGAEIGFAILTDIEAFFFIRAAQIDERTNIMFAPKVTTFNGQLAFVSSNVERPFVTSLIPVVGFASVGVQPQIQVIPEGTTLTVTPVVSADRRFVRMTLSPTFSNITDVFTFSFAGGGGTGAANVGTAQGGAQVGLGGQGQGGIGQVGVGGGQLGAGGGLGGLGGGLGGLGGGQIQLGLGGIGGGPIASNSLLLGLPQQVGAQGQLGQGQQGQQQQGQQQQGQQQQGIGGGVGTQTIQQPVVEIVTIQTTVSVPDGGTVLLGGVKRLREGRNMAGVPILNKIPYISRLFKNTGVGRETESLMMMVTPRIIIQEEEEQLLGIPLQ